MFHMIEELKHVCLLAPQADGSLMSDVVSLKNCNRAWIKVLMNQTEADRCTITLMQATDVAAGTNKAVTNEVPIWYNADMDTADTLARTTDAKTYQFSATHDYKKVVWFQIDPSNALDVASGYDCIYLTSGGSNVANILSAEIFMDMKYKEDVLPAAITD